MNEMLPVLREPMMPSYSPYMPPPLPVVRDPLEALAEVSPEAARDVINLKSLCDVQKTFAPIVAKIAEINATHGMGTRIITRRVKNRFWDSNSVVTEIEPM